LTPSQLNFDDAMMVRAVGIEPTLFSELDFESSASTSSATPAGDTIDGDHVQNPQRARVKAKPPRPSIGDRGDAAGTIQTGRIRAPDGLPYPACCSQIGQD
jgi:hypothetical protein